MISNKSTLASRLGWVLGETEAALEQARQHFSTHVQDGDEAALDQVIDGMQNVLGVLDVLDTEGAYMLCRELVLTLEALRNKEVTNIEAGRDASADGLVQLSEYLRHLQDGYVDLPVIVLPTLNNLRAAREAELLSEHLVFLPEQGAMSNELIGIDEYLDLPMDRLGQATKKLRFYMQKALLGWFNEDKPDHFLMGAGKVAHNMLTLHKAERLRSLWWVVGALTQALAQNKLEHSVAIKMLMGRMEREIRRFGEMGEEAYNSTVPDELLKNLLYYVGLSDASDGGVLAKVKEAYHLDLYLPQGETLQELRQYYTMPGRDLWRSVAVSLREELKGLMQQAEGLAEAENQSPVLASLAERTDSLAQALNMLGLTKASELTTGLANLQKSEASEGDMLGEEALASMCDHYVRLEKVVNEYAETGFDITDDVFVSDGEAADPATSRSVVRNALTELRKAQNEFGAFYKEDYAFVHLEEAVKVLRGIGGTMGMLEAEEVVPLADGVAQYLKQDVLDQRRKPSDQEVACVADSLTLLEATLSAMGDNEDYLSLLPMSYEKLEELNQYSQVDLVEYTGLVEAKEVADLKKKAQQSAPKTLYQKLRQQKLIEDVPA